MSKQITEHTIIIGAGPCGLAAAISLQEIGIKPLILEKHNIVHSISQYPTYMTFFSTAERLEIAGIPFTSANEKPTRLEALNYYRTVAQRNEVQIKPFMTVTSVTKSNEHFIVNAINQYDETFEYITQNVIVATGYFDHPNMLGIPGEELPKVSHFFREAHPFTGLQVAIIGGSNSSIDAALELERVGAHVTIVYRGEQYSKSIKPWVRPTIESKVNNGEISMMFSSRVERITNRTIEVSTPDGLLTLENDYVLALTGFHPDHDFLTQAGVTFEAEGHPTFNPDTMESNVKGIYLAGVVVSRKTDANEIFIESGRFHGDKIAQHMAKQQLI